MNRMDKWLSQNKNFIALVTSILLIAAVIAVLFICANLSKDNNVVEEDTLETQKLAVPVVVEEPTTIDIPEETAEKQTEPETELETVPQKTTEELAWEVLNGGYNGADRERYLGDRYQEVQNWIDANFIPPAPAYVEYEDGYSYSYPSGSGVLTPDKGVNYYYGIMETYYNLDMSGVVDWMHSLGYGGEYWVRGDGVKMLGDYVMVAADYGWLPKGSIVECSLGTAIVCDTGLGGYNWLDIAVTW